jgi:hypothetical protein
MILALWLLPVAAAHPLDDQAQMVSEVVIVSDSSIELVLDFHYVSVLASLSEFNNGLDGNGDGVITRAERDRRFEALVLEMAFSFAVAVNGGDVPLKPEFDRFELNNMDSAQPLDFEVGVYTHSLRIHYRLVFAWEGNLAPGEHKVEYYFSGQQSVVHTPAKQMIAFDARVSPRVQLENVAYDVALGAYPRLTFGWKLTAPPAAQTPVVVSAKPEDTALPSGLGESPAWLTMLAGVFVAVAGLAGAARNVARKRGRAAATSLLLIVAGGAIILGACVRLNLISL